MARKQKHEEHVNHERWLVSYADFITLLFAFFVVMYSISSVNDGKFRVLSDAMVAAFRSAPKSMEPIQVGVPAKSPRDQAQEKRRSPATIEVPRDPLPAPVTDEVSKIDRPEDKGVVTQTDATQGAGSAAPRDRSVAMGLGGMADEIERAMAPLIKEHLIAVRRNDLWLEVEINTSILYPSGSALLNDSARPVLDQLGEILKPFANPIRVEGFTDNVPIKSLPFPSNWELSAARAAGVVQRFAKAGVDPLRMAAVGYGQYHPIADNGTEAGRAQNRRVVIVVLETVLGENALAAKNYTSQATVVVPPPASAVTFASQSQPPLPRGPNGEPIDVTGMEGVGQGVITLPIQLPFVSIIPPLNLHPAMPHKEKVP